MGGVITFDSSRTDWFTSNQAVDLWSNIHNQVIEFIGYIGYPFKIISKIDSNIIERQIQISSITIAPCILGGYEIKKPFNVSVECLSDNEFVGTFDEAEVSFSGSTVTEAVNAVKIEAIEVYKLYRSAEKLGPRPKRQLAVLEKYVGEKAR